MKSEPISPQALKDVPRRPLQRDTILQQAMAQAEYKIEPFKTSGTRLKENNQELSELEALKKEVAELRAQVQQLTANTRNYGGVAL